MEVHSWQVWPAKQGRCPPNAGLGITASPTACHATQQTGGAEGGSAAPMAAQAKHTQSLQHNDEQPESLILTQAQALHGHHHCRQQ